jgi:hypothetical protein
MLKVLAASIHRVYAVEEEYLEEELGIFYNIAGAIAPLCTYV